jgi:tRNA-2-methylthio-N6-dimethylallyladenosine synthase
LNEKKLFYIKTFGCQMNDYDSARISRLLADEGYIATEDPAQARIIIINTCSVRDKPEQKVYSILGRMKKYKAANPDTILAVGGCVAQQEGIRLYERNPSVDVIFGTQTIHRLPELIRRVRESVSPVVDLSFDGDNSDYYHPTPIPQQNSYRAMITIMQGCDNFCSFCIVPYVRGREMSRKLEDILAEAQSYVEKGVKEITLLGQNVNSYGRKGKVKTSFSDLLRLVNDIEGLERIRFTTSHPKDLTPDLISLFGSLEHLCEHIHLPVQSGSDAVLKRMNRKYTRDDYLRRVEMLRQTCPGIAIATDLIVGFPGETDRDFRQTLDLMEEVKFDSSFSFKYSPRPGTKAADWPDDVPPEAKTERLSELQTLQKKITLANNCSMEGQTVEILVEGPSSKKHPNQMTGRTRTNKIVNFNGATDLKNKLLKVKITRGSLNSLTGKQAR